MRRKCSILRKPWHCTCRCFDEILSWNKTRIYRLCFHLVLFIFCFFFKNRISVCETSNEFHTWRFAEWKWEMNETIHVRCSRTTIQKSKMEATTSMRTNHPFVNQPFCVFALFYFSISILRKPISFCAQIQSTQIHRYRIVRSDRLACPFDEHMHCVHLYRDRANQTNANPRLLLSSSFHILHNTHQQLRCAEWWRTEMVRSTYERTVCRRVVSSSMCHCRQIHNTNEHRHSACAHASFGYYPSVHRCGVYVYMCICIITLFHSDENRTMVNQTRLPLTLFSLYVLWSEWVQNANKNNNKQDTNV